MKIIICNWFKNDFEKTFKNYNFWISDLILKLKISRIIKLDKPYCKIKMNLKWVSLRWIIFINEIWNIFPVFFVLKKNKTFWENLILTKEILNIINSLLWKYIRDYKKWDYENY